MKRILSIFDFLERRPRVTVISLVAVSFLLAASMLTLRFSEDISDFLPLGTVERDNLSVFQNVSGAGKMFILFSNPGDPDRTVEAIEAFEDAVSELDAEGWCGGLVSRFDMDSINGVMRYVYDNIPYFLTPSDYERMDSLLNVPGYVGAQLSRDKQLLLLPSSGMVKDNLTRDPLGLFGPVLSRLQGSSSSLSFEMYEGCIFTPDMSRAVVMLDSPFGSSETEYNSQLLALLESASDKMAEAFPDVSNDIVGGPAIAVGNSSRIKKDSVLAISLSAVLIVLLLICSFSSLSDILLIFLSIGWGLLFALGGLAIFRDSVSIIVIGISSVILGIAVNYPLHLIAHKVYQPDRREAMKEIVSPLVTGNITTVGAFLALVPLKSSALRDLGLFASLLLVGTIIFVLIYLPHFLTAGNKSSSGRSGRLSDRLSRVCPEKSRAAVIAVALVTVVLGAFSIRTGFDTDMSNINYMTSDQREDMQYFEDLLTNDDSHTAQSVYVLSSGQTFDDALERNTFLDPVIDSLEALGLARRQQNVSQFIVSTAIQKQRLKMWEDFVAEHLYALTDELELEAARAGFSSGAFSPFRSLTDDPGRFGPQDIEFFEPLTSTVFTQNFTSLDGGARPFVVSILNVEPADLDEVEKCFSHCFDVAGMNSALSATLSDNFNYIGWVCSLIVFFFLWFSFGRFELALISFLPMAISWLWILGLMALLGIKFNIVNIILATFIFGQGDDYTIFITEGCQYEYAHRRPILSSYKSSILKSAVIMFVGIGTLIVARHPAMRSLAEVTIIGMFSVVLMAYMIPPLLFSFLTTRKGVARRHPITVGTLLHGTPTDPAGIVSGRYIYKGKDITRVVNRNLAGRAGELQSLDVCGTDSYTIHDDGYGELPLLLALTHPDLKVVSIFSDETRMRVAEVAAEGLVSNIEFKMATDKI